MQISTQSSMFPSITYKVNSVSANNFDAQVKDKVSFTQLPSNKIDAATMKPSALFEKYKVIETIVSAANALQIEHDNYEKQYVDGGRMALYGVLSKIYSLAIQINFSDYCDQILKELRNQLSLKKNIKVQKNSHAITMLVRWVVGANRQTAHNYSKALQAAFSDNVAAADLSEYFVKRGGLQSVKSETQKKNNEAKDAVSSEFDRFVSNADKNHNKYSNTKIEWTEEVYGDKSSTKMMIVGESWGGGKMQGYRAFTVSSDAYKKICKILADEVFKDQSIEVVTKFIDAESENIKSVATSA